MHCAGGITILDFGCGIMIAAITNGQGHIVYIMPVLIMPLSDSYCGGLQFALHGLMRNSNRNPDANIF